MGHRNSEESAQRGLSAPAWPSINGVRTGPMGVAGPRSAPENVGVIRQIGAETWLPGTEGWMEEDRFGGPDASSRWRLGRLGQANIHCLETFGSFLKIELDRLPLFEGAEPVHLDGRMVHEHIGTSVRLRNEAEALLSVEPLDCPRSHGGIPLSSTPVVHTRRAQTVPHGKTVPTHRMRQVIDHQPIGDSLPRKR